MTSEQRRAYKKEWQRQDRAKNPEKYRQRVRAYYAKNDYGKNYAREWRKKQSADPLRAKKAAEYQREYRKRHPERNRASMRRQNLRRNYGLTTDAHDELRAKQGNACAICLRPFENKPKSVHVDHCHKTKIVRGLLCPSCNLGIGKFYDDPEMMRRAAAYLEKHRQ